MKSPTCKNIDCPWRTTRISEARCAGTRLDARLLKKCHQAACERLDAAALRTRGDGPGPERIMTESRRRRKAERPACSAAGCERSAHATGLCSRHYQAARRQKAAGPACASIPKGERRQPACTGCGTTDKKLNAVGLCGDCVGKRLRANSRRLRERSRDPLGALLEGQPELLEAIQDMAAEELRTPEAQAIWLLRQAVAPERAGVA